MAEEKKAGGGAAKPGGKPAGGKPAAAPAPKKSDPFAEIVSLLLMVMIAVYLLNGFVSMFSGNSFIARAYQTVFPTASSTRPLPLSEQGIWLSHTRPIKSLINPIGVKVVVLGNENGNTAVYDSPGGRQIGEQGVGAHGKITQGPVEFQGETYYFAQFDSGKSGWVKEGDIGALTGEPSPAENFLLWFYSSITFFKFLLAFICLCLIIFIGYVVLELTKIRKNQRALLYPEIAQTEVDVNPKWRKILAHIESLNESDWKLAIIEADIMLDDILDKLHLPGDTIGEKMKAVEKSDFATIDNAWEAHKIRNQIAHEGGEFILTQHEARRVIALYQTVFEEFQVL